MLSILRPKHIMILGIVAMLFGLGFFALWNHFHAPRLLRNLDLIKWATRMLGRYGLTAIYFFGGLIVFLRGYAAMRAEERSRNIR